MINMDGYPSAVSPPPYLKKWWRDLLTTCQCQGQVGVVAESN